MKRMLRVGERVAWPALGMVRNRMTVEVSVSSCFCLNMVNKDLSG